MMAGNPSWWNMHSSLRSATEASDHQAVSPSLLLSQTHPSLLPQYLHGSSTSSPTLGHDDHHAQEIPHSWSQLLLGGLASEQEERFNPSLFQSTRILSSNEVDVKQELSGHHTSNNNNSTNNIYGYHQHHHHHHHEEQEAGACNNRSAAAWSQANLPASSPKSCVTSLSNSNSILDFSTNKRPLQTESHQHGEHSNSECNSTATGGIPKKPRVQPSSNPPLKVRKEKLGDRITALHQLVSPFGKTDTASVLLEAIGYIRFLQGQIEALSSPYLGNNNAPAKNLQSVHGERNSLFPDHPGQLLNDSCMKRRGAASNQEDNEDATRDLKSRGLCLVPVSCTQLVGNDIGADYWAPSFGGGF